MSEEKQNLKQEQGKESPKVNELSEKELKEVSGGEIPGESTDDKHKDWIELV